MRGDVPECDNNHIGLTRFSPHARGCSHKSNNDNEAMRVFPACAGMFPLVRVVGGVPSCFPRMRGDVPYTPQPPHVKSKFSPHARGCSVRFCSSMKARSVFPACAGMFRIARSSLSISGRFPRMRGDVPVQEALREIAGGFSPHARGCSEATLIERIKEAVFPACAGMFRLAFQLHALHACFPRMRGDVPAATATTMARRWFSPHARGCSLYTPTRTCQPKVFPACAGMFRIIPFSSTVIRCFPRMRGDVPETIEIGVIRYEFSPHARGCSCSQT